MGQHRHFKLVASKLRQSLPDLAVEGIFVEDYIDHAGDAALKIRIVYGALRKPLTGMQTILAADAVHEALINIGEGRYPYVTFISHEDFDSDAAA